MVRAECLDWLLIVSRRHWAQVLRVYAAHYNAHRPHRALGLEPPIHRPIRPSSAGIGTVCTGGIGSAVCSTSTTDKLHERVSAPYAIRNRLQVFAASTRPLLDYYEKRGLLFSVAAVGTVDEVSERILHAPRDVTRRAPPAGSQPAPSGSEGVDVS
jgi:hypothetical protein